MQIIGLLVVGLIIGALARLIKPGKQALGLLGTLALGVVGAIIGGVLVGAFDPDTSIFELNILGFIVALIAAVLLIGVAESVLGKNKTKSRV